MHTEGSDDDDNGEYEVGYGKPPEATRFPNQRRRNMGGRRRGSQNRKTIIRRVAFESVEVLVGGKKRRLSHIELVLSMLRNAAAQGNREAARIIRKLLGIMPVDEPHVVKGVLIAPEPALSHEEWFERFAPAEVKRLAESKKN